MLNTGQQAAFDAFTEFANTSDRTIFAMFGAAGTGKSFTSGRMLDIIYDGTYSTDEILWLAPT